jgi:hypothetical protein
LASPASAAPSTDDTYSCFLGEEGRSGSLYLDAFLVVGGEAPRLQADWYAPEDAGNALRLNLSWAGLATPGAPTDETLRAVFFVGENAVPEGRRGRIEIRRPSGQLLVAGDVSRALDHHSLTIAVGVLATMIDRGDLVVRALDDRGRELGRMAVTRATLGRPAQLFAQVRPRWEAMLANPEHGCEYLGPNVTTHQ